MSEIPAKKQAKAERRKEIGKRITEFYTEKGLSRTEFAKKLEIKYETLRSYEEGRAEPGSDFFEKLFEFYKESEVVKLLFGMKPSSELEYVSLPSDEDLHKIPVITTVNASSLRMGFKDEDVIDWIWSTKIKDKAAFGLKITGESMYPQIHDGDYVLCSPQKQFISGKIYVVVSRDSEHTVKQVFKEPGGYRLQAVNPDFKSVFLPESEVLKLIRVVQVVSHYE